MGLFDTLNRKEERKTKEVKVNSETAFMLACLTMAGIDGKIHEDEMVMLEKLSRGNAKGTLEKATIIIKSMNVVDSAELIAKVLNPEQQAVALANLIDIAMADGVLDGKEKDLLEYYIRAFQVDQTTVESIINVISIKNNKRIF